MVIGDLHIPHRANSLPPKFRKLLVRFFFSFLLSFLFLFFSFSFLFFLFANSKHLVIAQVPGKIQHVLCTGNLCNRETFDFLKYIASDVHVVKGDFDEALKLILCLFLSTIILAKTPSMR